MLGLNPELLQNSHKKSEPLTTRPHLVSNSLICYGTRRDESTPPCRRVADTSRRRCGRTSSFCCSKCCRRGFPPGVVKKVVVSSIWVLLFAEYYSLLSFSFNFLYVSDCPHIFTICCALAPSWRSPWYGKRFHGSTTLTHYPFYYLYEL